VANENAWPIDNMLGNAVGAIEVGVLDMQQGAADPRRLASAVRNLTAGVLLLAKEKLRQMSPADSDEVLLRERLRFKCGVGGRPEVVGHGDKTVDVQGIQDRFRDLEIPLDLGRLRRLVTIRNHVEHRAPRPEHSEAEVRAALAAAYVLVLQLLRENLGLDPATTISPEIWLFMSQQAELQRALELRSGLSLKRMANVPKAVGDLVDRFCCLNCRSSLIEASNVDYFAADLKCLVCSETTDRSDLLEEILEDVFGIDDSRFAKDGVLCAIGLCPACACMTFHVGDDLCLACGEGRTYESCLRCDNDLSLDEQDDGGLCGYCAHVRDGNQRDD
jgi:hypothetical protein